MNAGDRGPRRSAIRRRPRITISMVGRPGQRETLRADGDPCRLSDKTAALFATVFAIMVAFLRGRNRIPKEQGITLQGKV